MPTVSDFLENVKKIDVKSLIEVCVAENEVKIINLNREDQIFDEGIDSNGQSFFNYAPMTQNFYDEKPPTDHKGENKGENRRFNMFWSGDSYYSFYAYVKGNKLYITTSRRGRKLLMMHGGKEIFGLTNRNSEIANWEIIAPCFNEKVRKQLL